ncbi:MAG: hypothetical protein HS100_00760 [Anaerolineales bacterium]|nr:hypothetical protein [Anaerolineales bacterium]
MRPFEIIIPVLLTVYLAWGHPRPLAVRLLPALALLATLIHFAVEGYRWQMIPLYALASLLAISALTKIFGTSDWKSTASYLTLIVVAVSTALPILLPVPRIPAPSGPFQVGTRIIEMIDESRRELYSGKDEPRRYMIQAWYPADVKETDERAPWMERADIFAPAIATYIDLPSFFLDHLALAQIPTYKNADIAASGEKFPVILFSHGWNGFNAQNAGQALELASHGFIVIGIQHTYGAVVTVFPDGTVAPNNPNALPADADDPNYEEVARILADQWADDMSHTLDFISSADAGNPFAPSVDSARVGVYGHSTGGGAAIQFCGVDLRCKSVLGMDPFMRPVSAEVIESGLPMPSFFMFSQAWADITDSKNNRLFLGFNPRNQNNLGAIVIEGTRHYDFSDLPLFSPIAPQLGLKGPLNGKRVTEIVNGYLLDFFEMTLRDNASGLFDASSPYPEVKVYR